MSNLREKNSNRRELNQADYSAMPDGQLVLLAVKNDEHALRTLVKRHLKLVYNAARFYCADADDADDIVQETFVKMWKNLTKYIPEKSFSNWIFEIAKNTALNRIKKRF